MSSALAKAAADSLKAESKPVLPDMVIFHEHFGVSVNGTLRVFEAEKPVTERAVIALAIEREAHATFYKEI